MQSLSQGVSFPAIDRQGQVYELTPLYRASASDPSETKLAKRLMSDLVGMIAADGRDVRRSSRGRYFVATTDGTELVALFSSDPKAV